MEQVFSSLPTSTTRIPTEQMISSKALLLLAASRFG
jgi:hypothetical protein